MRTVVICCGFNDYEHGPLTTCVRDATKLYTLLTEERSVTASNSAFRYSKVLTNGEVTAAEIVHAVSTAIANADFVWFSFSGHALEREGDLRLLLPRWSPERPDQYCVRASEIERILRSNRDKQFVVVLDACHAGSFGGQVSFADSRDVDTSVEGEAGVGGIVMSACRRGQAARDGNPAAGLLNGVFTSRLLSVMEEYRHRRQRLGALQLFFGASSAMRERGDVQTPTLYANGLTEDITILEGAVGGVPLEHDVPPSLRNELDNFLESMRIIVEKRRVGIKAAERELEKLARKFFECRNDSFIVEEFEEHVTEAYENAEHNVIACTTPLYFAEWRDGGVAKSLVESNRRFIERKKGRVLRFYFADGDFRSKYPELTNILRNHLDNGVEAYVIWLDAYRDTILRWLDEDLSRFEVAFVDGRTYLRTRFEQEIRIQVNQDPAYARREYEYGLKRFLTETQLRGIWKPLLSRTNNDLLDWGRPLASVEVEKLRTEVDGMFLRR